MKIDWIEVWEALESERANMKYYSMLPFNVKKKIQSIVEAQLKPKRKRK